MADIALLSGVDFWPQQESELNLSLDKKHLQLLACLAFGWTNMKLSIYRIELVDL